MSSYYVNAQPFDLPIPFQLMDTQQDIINSFTSTASVFTGTTGKSPGFAGNGLQKPVNLGKPAFLMAALYQSDLVLLINPSLPQELT